MKLSMIKLFLLSFTFIACNKEGNEQNGLDSLKYKSFNTIEEALLGTEDADLILSFAYNYNSTSNRFYSFNNSAFFQKTKPDPLMLAAGFGFEFVIIYVAFNFCTKNVGS